MKKIIFLLLTLFVQKQTQASWQDLRRPSNEVFFLNSNSEIITVGRPVDHLIDLAVGVPIQSSEGTLLLSEAPRIVLTESPQLTIPVIINGNPSNFESAYCQATRICLFLALGGTIVGLFTTVAISNFTNT